MPALPVASRSPRTMTAKTIVNTISTRALPQPFPAPMPALRRPQVAIGTSQTSREAGPDDRERDGCDGVVVEPHDRAT